MPVNDELATVNPEGNPQAACPEGNYDAKHGTYSGSGDQAQGKTEHSNQPAGMPAPFNVSRR